MQTKKSGHVLKSKLVPFFLLAIALLNLVGNFLGIISEFTFYHYGLTMTLVVSRYIEDLVRDYALRTIILGLLTLASSGVYYVLYHYSQKGRLIPLLLGLFLYALDFMLISSTFVNEPTLFMHIMQYTHLLCLSLFIVTIFLTLLRREERSPYDFA